MNVVIAVPRRDDGGWRDKLWEFCKARWEKYFPDWPIITGYHFVEEGPFNRSMAINRALNDRDWDVALIIDSDTISDPDAVRRAVDYARQTGALSVAHNIRYMMNKQGTDRILGGYGGDWKRRVFVKTTYADSVSCAVAVSRSTWDLVNGFDERFVGWGFEDTAFRIAVETLTDQPMHLEDAACFHLWHPESPEAAVTAPTRSRNHALKLRYEVAHWDRNRLLAVLRDEPDPWSTVGSIPRILHRTVPEETSEEVEKYWDKFGILHPTWDLRTYREPIDPADWPMTGDLFDKCQNGAQKAGLIRLEALLEYGGVYVDSDVEPYRPIDSLTHAPAFAAWEDEKVVPDAIIGAAPGHPAIRECIARARKSIEAGEDAWKSGPGVTTAVFPGRDDIVLLPPGAFYPAHYLEKSRLGTNSAKPWVFMEHKWHHSWGTDAQKTANARRQRATVTQTEVVEMPDARIVVCMPWHDVRDPARQAAHYWCVKYWMDAGLDVIEGDGTSRSEMCNNAVYRAIGYGAEVIVIADADTWTSRGQIAAAARKAIDTGHLVHAFDEYVKLSSQSTNRLIKRKDLTVDLARRGGTIKRDHGSGLGVMTVKAWKAIGGYDERFEGWGFEDQAFNLAAEVILGPIERVPGPAIHWFHRADPTKQRDLRDDPGVKLIQEYCRAAGRIPETGRVARLAKSGIITLDGHTDSSIDAMLQLLSDSRNGSPLVQL